MEAMIRQKTAVLFVASLKIGALIGGASVEDAKNLYNFGLNIGMGFQLKDDLLDTFGDEQVFGKKTGGDILTNKKTFLFLKALETAEPDDAAELLKLYNCTSSNPKQKVKRVVEIFKNLKVFKAADKEIDKFFNKGMASLDRVNADEDKKDKIREVAHKMIDRDK